jgi:hypothetical protein
MQVCTAVVSQLNGLPSWLVIDILNVIVTESGMMDHNLILFNT